MDSKEQSARNWLAVLRFTIGFSLWRDEWSVTNWRVLAPEFAEVALKDPENTSWGGDAGARSGERMHSRQALCILYTLQSCQ